MRSGRIIGTQGLGSPYKKLEPWWEPGAKKEMQPLPRAPEGGGGEEMPFPISPFLMPFNNGPVPPMCQTQPETS